MGRLSSRRPKSIVPHLDPPDRISIAYNLATLAFLEAALMRQYRLTLLGSAVALALAGSSLVVRSEQAPAPVPAGGPFDSLHFRSIGPASMSGRISDLAVYEANPAIFYVGTGHG